jgi:hypothetical protein
MIFKTSTREDQVGRKPYLLQYNIHETRKVRLQQSSDRRVYVKGKKKERFKLSNSF